MKHCVNFFKPNNRNIRLTKITNTTITLKPIKEKYIDFYSKIMFQINNNITLDSARKF